MVGMSRTKGKKYAEEQRQSIEVFKSAIISNDKAKAEQRLGPCKIDGLLVYKDDQTSSGNSHRAKVLELVGCYHHGCPQCYWDRLELNEKRKMSMGYLRLVVSVEERLSWLKKQKELKTVFVTSNGLNNFVEDIKTIWECQFSKILEKGDNEPNEDQSDL